MKFSCLVVASLAGSALFGDIGVVQQVSGFSQYAPQQNAISLSENAQRDVYTMDDWAVNAGAQKAEGFELTSYDGQDYYAATNQDIPAGSPVLFVPNQMMFTSSSVAQEFGDALSQAENELVTCDCGELVPLFRLYAKVLVEYEKGENSPWYSWLNSLPRMYNTGASMTYACFECLPPYAAWLAMSERTNSVNFQKAIRNIYSGIISEETASNTEVLKWAYNVAATRSLDRNGELFIAPLADMFNHGTETEVDINYDEEGNCMVYASKDIPAGSPLRMSLGDPTNPSPIFAKYGFLDDSSPATFCKVMHLRNEMQELGYDFSNLLFFKDTGDMSSEVYDVVLYGILAQDENLKQGFYQACMNGDQDTKQQYLEQYYPNIIDALRTHVDGTLIELDQLSQKANSYDPSTHPRVPVILQHNAFVKETFLRVKANLDNM
ncbi:ribulose-1,5-bisphosphate carboxylase-like protein [Fragilariopsis cylindrus CCMP1102]|uniref:Ribulose-1,5-bisphosphate carboxylase-like protein n=1 Tax=Fragilariopsis cylindrus CCMP1102 TaxID=635003 RepID=A0A1E7FQH8_9STRA|nr:ribulose-1,5-bisphosphate carboxylase-like protein [Fragilariopsis cylindrus CCMP1102]|eukprot:OEU20387.1 ribulose-1,5-bisphosphate carboxylase-like protein [Fragilariopsis cylindrus CCMP1102]